MAATNYPQRSDLPARNATQPARAATGQTYGQAGRQIAAQQAIPLPDVVPLDAPTGRPNEPVTHGVPTGPGPGPAEAGVPQAPLGQELPADHIADFFRGLYTVYPTRDLADLLAVLDAQAR